jgi:hypothetical protein
MGQFSSKHFHFRSDIFRKGKSQCLANPIVFPYGLLAEEKLRIN